MNAFQGYCCFLLVPSFELSSFDVGSITIIRFNVIYIYIYVISLKVLFMRNRNVSFVKNFTGFSSLSCSK